MATDRQSLYGHGERRRKRSPGSAAGVVHTTQGSGLPLFLPFLPTKQRPGWPEASDQWPTALQSCVAPSAWSDILADSAWPFVAIPVASPQEKLKFSSPAGILSHRPHPPLRVPGPC